MDIKIQKKKRIKRSMRSKRRSVFIFVSLFIIIIGFIFIMNNDRLLISSVEISGNDTILDIDIRESIDKVIQKRIIFIPMNNIFFINTRRLENRIKNKFPKIYNAHIVIKNGSKLVVKVEERSPHSLWCKYFDEKSEEDKEESLDFNEECYFADQKGFIYTRAPYFSDGIFEKIYVTDDMLGIGEHVLDTDNFNNFFKFLESLNDNFGIIIDHIVLTKDNETKIYINSLLNKRLLNEPYIIYHTDSDNKIIGRNMNLMVNHELFKKDFSSNPNKLIFIDLRIPDQIRYKFNTAEEKSLE